jgi:hypothetical protein
MPYKSQAQRKKFHAMLSRGEISAKIVAEFDRASKGKKLPKRIGKKIRKEAAGTLLAEFLFFTSTPS